jgi:uncharacterized NAD(P)/FAD-binding protein YdhS
MRARVLSIEFNTPIEQELNSWLDEAGPIKVEHTTVINESNGGHKLIVFYSDQQLKARPAQVCAQCRKNPPANGLKTCAECQKYQKDYRQKRKAESKTRYP